MKILFTKKTPESDGFISKFYQFKTEITLILYKSFQRAGGGTTPKLVF